MSGNLGLSCSYTKGWSLPAPPHPPNQRDHLRLRRHGPRHGDALPQRLGGGLHLNTCTGNQDKPTGSDVKNTSTVVKQFVVDFSSETYKPLMEHEVNGLDYRYVYSDKARLSVVVQGIENGSASLLDDAGELHAYYHCDYLGTTDYLTSAVNSKVISWTSYSEWGEITHNAVLKCGQRELDLVKEYATHDFDAVLNMYYAKARFYDADNRRFVAVDPILDPSQYDLREYVKEPMQLVQYLYVKDNAVIGVDLLGLCYFDAQGNWSHDNWEYTGGYIRKESPKNQTLGQGDTGYAVIELQKLLCNKGYLNASDCDGFFGPKTLKAVQAFQEVHAVTVDGIVGPETWRELFVAATAKNNQQSSSTSTSTAQAIVTNISYVFYTTGEESNFAKQAEWQKKRLEGLGQDVHLATINDLDEFLAAWDMIDENGAKYVIILSHSNERSLILLEGSSSQALSVDGKNRAGEEIGNLSTLAFKPIQYMELYSCNAGHVDVYNKAGSNVASVMSTRISGSVLAYDGNVGFGPSGVMSLLNFGNDYTPRMSNSQDGFHSLAIQYGGKDRSPIGAVYYVSGELVES